MQHCQNLGAGELGIIVAILAQSEIAALVLSHWEADGRKRLWPGV